MTLPSKRFQGMSPLLIQQDLARQYLGPLGGRSPLSLAATSSLG